MKKSLGRGLSSLLAEQFHGDPTDCPVGAIEPNPDQPRTHFNEESLHELAASIKEHGVINPLVVRPGESGRYILIAGERRWRAAQLAGLAEVPIRVQFVEAQKGLEIAIIENVQRDDITPIEAARAYRRLIDEFSLTQEEVATKVGKSRAAIANLVRLLRLPPRIIDALEAGIISEGHARAMLAVDDPAIQLAILEKTIAENLTVRDVEKIASQPKIDPNQKKQVRRKIEYALAILEENVSEALGCPVTITKTPHGGKIILQYYSEDDLDRVIQRLLPS